MLVTTKLLSQNIFSRKKFCYDKHNFVATNIIFVVTKVLSRQAYFCSDKRRVLSRQTCVCRDETFVATKMRLVAALPNDNLFVWIGAREMRTTLFY